MLYETVFHWAVNVTVPLVERKFLKLVAVVLLMLVAVVVDEPYVWVTLSIPVIFQPANVYPVRVGLLTVNAVSNVAVSGCVVPCVPLFNAYDIVYVFAVHVPVIVTDPLVTPRFVLLHVTDAPASNVLLFTDHLLNV